MTFFIANEMGIPVDGTEINITGKLDPSKFSGAAMSVRASYQEIAIGIEVKSSASADQIAQLLAAVEAGCPVSDNITNATPVTISMTAV